MDRTEIKRRQVLDALETSRRLNQSGNLTVGHVMTTDPICVRPEMTLLDLIGLFHAKGFRHILVTDSDEQVVGVVSDRDVSAFLRPDCQPDPSTLVGITASEIMSSDLVTSEPGMPLEQQSEVPDGDTSTFYQTPAVGCGGQCVAQLRRCSVGQVNGSFLHASCEAQCSGALSGLMAVDEAGGAGAVAAAAIGVTLVAVSLVGAAVMIWRRRQAQRNPRPSSHSHSSRRYGEAGQTRISNGGTGNYDNTVFGDEPRIDVTAFDNLTVDFAMEIGARVIIRGLRAMSDFEYEFEMALMNKHLYPEVETVFMMASQKYLYVSSSRLKELVRLGRAVDAFVPAVVAKKLHEKLGRTRPG